MDKLNNGVKTNHSHTAIVTSLLVLLALLLLPTMFTAAPSVYPTGTTRYDPDKAWNGYTIHDTPDEQGAVLIDMNGQVVRHWTELTAVPSPFRILPGGYVMGGTIPREPHQEAIALVQLDWDGNVVWEFQNFEEVETEDGATVWASRLHHDWQREGNPIGYYAPDANPRVNGGKTLVLSHTNLVQADITDKRLEDDVLLEVTWDGDVTWKWLASEHVDEFGFSEAERNALHRSVHWNEERESADWLHINAASYVGPNHWYDDGDDRFHPENIIWSSREANIMAIIGRQLGDGMARKKDTDVIALWPNLNGGTVFGADGAAMNTANTHGCISGAKANKFGNQLYLIHHPNAVATLSKQAATTADTAAASVAVIMPKTIPPIITNIILAGIRPLINIINTSFQDRFDWSFGKSTFLA